MSKEKKVFQKPKSKNSKKKRKISPLGWALIIWGLVIFLFLIAPFVFMEAKYRLGRLLKKEEEVSGFGQILAQIERESGFLGIIRESDLDLLDPEDPDFSIVIPKIDVNSRVFTNVDVEDQTIWRPVLAKGVAHAFGSYLPGEEGTVFIFGHSTDYLWNINRFNAVFYLLKELKQGDRVSLFYDEKRFEYEVTETKIVKPDEVEEINNSLDEDRLILSTCWPPGTTWKRLLVFANPV